MLCNSNNLNNQGLNSPSAVANGDAVAVTREVVPDPNAAQPMDVDEPGRSEWEDDVDHVLHSPTRSDYAADDSDTESDNDEVDLRVSQRVPSPPPNESLPRNESSSAQLPPLFPGRKRIYIIHRHFPRPRPVIRWNPAWLDKTTSPIDPGASSASDNNRPPRDVASRPYGQYPWSRNDQVESSGGESHDTTLVEGYDGGPPSMVWEWADGGGGGTSTPPTLVDASSSEATQF